MIHGSLDEKQYLIELMALEDYISMGGLDAKRKEEAKIKVAKRDYKWANTDDPCEQMGILFGAES